jgi:hypothetical protein
MPITYRTFNPNTGNLESEEVKHLGEVVDIRKFRAMRNWADTLDYTDYRSTDVVEALVYVGRRASSDRFAQQKQEVKTLGLPKHYYAAGEELLPIDRFEWLDCTSLFVDRGVPAMHPAVDDIRHPDVVIDYIEFLEATRVYEAAANEHNMRNARAEAARREEEERNHPRVGKKMVVASGRKVKPGTQGTVAYVHSSGRVLLKDDDKWQDRKAQGIWVDGRRLKAR